MVPGLIAGHYRPEDCRIDLGPLAAHAGARFFQDSAVGIDPAQREVITARGERVHYDVLALDIGAGIGQRARTAQHALCLGPGPALLARWVRFRASPRRDERGRIALIADV